MAPTRPHWFYQKFLDNVVHQIRTQSAANRENVVILSHLVIATIVYYFASYDKDRAASYLRNFADQVDCDPSDIQKARDATGSDLVEIGKLVNLANTPPKGSA